MNESDRVLEAWSDYLEFCRSADEREYEVAEPWAWDQLRARLYELDHANLEESR